MTVAARAARALIETILYRECVVDFESLVVGIR